MTRWAEPIVIIECTLYHFNYLLLDHKLQKKKVIINSSHLTESITGFRAKPGSIFKQDEGNRPQQQCNKCNQRRRPMWVQSVEHLRSILSCK